MSDQHQHRGPHGFVELIGGRQIGRAERAAGAERHRGAVDVKVPPISKPRRCLLNKRVTNAVGKVFNDSQRQPLSSVTADSRFFGQRAFADAAVVVAFLSAKSQQTDAAIIPRHLGP